MLGTVGPEPWGSGAHGCAKAFGTPTADRWLAMSKLLLPSAPGRVSLQRGKVVVAAF